MNRYRHGRSESGRRVTRWSVVAASLLSGALTMPAFAEQSAALRAPAGTRWSVIGGVDHPSVLQPLDAGRALVCGERYCATWDPSGGWSPTAYAEFSTNDLSYLRRSDGSVVVIDGEGARTSKIWSPATGRWTAAAPLPEPLKYLRTIELADGRIVAAGTASSIQRPRAYVTDADLHAWSTFVDAPLGFDDLALIVPIPSGALLFSRELVWRHTVGTAGWRMVSLVAAAPPRSPWLVDWGDDVLLISQRREKREAVLVGRDDQIRPAISLPVANNGFGLIPIPTARGAKMWLVLVGADAYLWRRPDEALIPLPSEALRPFAMIAALDDERLLGISASGVAMEIALDGRTPPGAPCDGLFRYLSQVHHPILPMSEVGLVSASCREAARRGEAASLLALVRGWTTQPDRADAGRALECALQDDAVIGALPRWFAEEKKGYFRAVCYQSLTAWPGTESVWKTALDHGVYLIGDHWWVDPSLQPLARDGAPEVRDRLIPAVLAADRHHAAGFDGLRDTVCAPEPTMSAARRDSCIEITSRHEAAWSQQGSVEAEHTTSNGAKVVRRAAVIVGASAVVAGAVVASHATRNQEISREIATAAGALGGATIGLVTVALSSMKGNWVSKNGHEIPTRLSVGAVVGGLVGGVAAYAATASPSSRAPVTGAALAFPWILAVTLDFN